jgi:hypothetical protein
VIYPLNSATLQAFAGCVPIVHTFHDTAIRLFFSICSPLWLIFTSLFRHITVIRSSWLTRSWTPSNASSSWGHSAYAVDLYIRDGSLRSCPPDLHRLLLDPHDGASFLRDLAYFNFPRRPILLAETRASLARSPPRHGTAFRTQVRLPDAARLQSYLGYRPLEVVRRTLEQTTQLATIPCGGLLRGHKQALYSFLNRRRLQGTVATDTFFAHTRDISGSLCAQVFYGIHSYYINVYGPAPNPMVPPHSRLFFARKASLRSSGATTPACNDGLPVSPLSSAATLLVPNLQRPTTPTNPSRTSGHSMAQAMRPPPSNASRCTHHRLALRRALHGRHPQHHLR